MTQTARYDIQINFLGPRGEMAAITVASTRGKETRDSLDAFFRTCLAPGWEAEVHLLQVSRFTPTAEQGLSGRHPCQRTGCDDYTPRRPKTSATDWPLCVCGAIAQDHD